ncbi:hypothetical protein [Glutamicibacter protophormiae]|uniref:Uncharacterized protein n=1 Tax=Glutamicibacter protophormiae TaxID=37930 RepID=A0ABS4XNT5_GLUPR|nr:hypothetical protein [Glutamicibacter protophormiae]MBP2398191.1 hypothetical protein [Glutamicibacter protophormiae]
MAQGHPEDRVGGGDQGDQETRAMGPSAVCTTGRTVPSSPFAASSCSPGSILGSSAE